ncbi:MAG: alpha-galactosidase [Mogibacterium sp.]|nr:alpha-galactosidase [Mogibacterium sp.]
MLDYKYVIHSNGTIDLAIGGITISGIIPYVNERSVLPVSVIQDNSQITYKTGEGSVTLAFRASSEELVISSLFEGFDHVHDIEPIGAATLCNADHVYIQGFGMEGPSGYYLIDGTDRRSHGIIGVCGESSAAAVFTTDQRRFSAQFAAVSEHGLYSDRIRFTAGINLECTAAGRTTLPDIHIVAGTDVTDCMERAAEKIAEEMGARTIMEPAFHWCSWYYHYENMSQQILDGFLAELETEQQGFRYIQLDAGYTPHIGDWLTFNHRYPEGLSKAAASITDAGHKAGIWIAPFMVGDQSELYAEHPDWILRNPDGSHYVRFRSYTEPKIWGNTDNDYYVLDMTNPGAYAYLREVFETYRAWGFTLFKTDFMLWGMQDTADVIRYDNTKTSFEIMRDTLAMIRAAIGEESYLLGSIAPFMPCIGYMDGMRIASDMGAQWTEGAFGPANLLQELPYDNYFNNIFWQNDPDSVILRDFATHLTAAETRSIALLQALSGGIITTSDPVHLLSEDRKDLLRFIRPAGRVHAGMPCLTSDGEDLVITHHLSDWNLFYVLNPTGHTLKIHYDLAELFGTGTFQYRFNWDDGDTIVSESCSYLSDAIGPHDSVLLFITREPMKVKPSNLWGRIKG